MLAILRMAFFLFLPPFFLGGRPLHADVNGIDIVYHIATMYNWQDIVREQLRKLEQSGLGTACDSLTVTVVGPKIVKVHLLFKDLSFLHKVTIIHASKNLKKFEFPGIEKVRQIARNKPNTKILYMHTKGVTHFGKPSEQPVRHWRQYMEYFAIERWQDCIKALETADICGVDYTKSIHGHHFFAGNFWWSRAAYISTCRLERKNRFDCEDFIGRGKDPIAKTFHQSGENPKLLNLYPQASFPEYYFFPPPSPYHQGIMNLYNFNYLAEYYRHNN